MVMTDQLPLSNRPASNEPGLKIYLFGPLRVLIDGEPLPQADAARRMRKVLQLLAYVALMGRRGVRREKLAEDLWPQEPNRTRILTSYVSTLRRVLEPHHQRGHSRYVAQKGERLYLEGGASLWVDVWTFIELAQKARRLAARCDLASAAGYWERAIALYDVEGLLPDGDFLPDVVEVMREDLRQQWLAGLRSLGRYYADQSSEEERLRASDFWQRLYAGEPQDDEAYEWLADHYLRTGQMRRLRSLEQMWTRIQITDCQEGRFPSA